MATSNLLVPLVVTAAAGGFLLVTRKKIRFVGDLAQVGDEAAFPVSALQVGAGIIIPPVAAYAVMKVEGQDAERVQGRVSALSSAAGDKIELPNVLRDALGVQTVQRMNVTAVYRNGKPLKV